MAEVSQQSDSRWCSLQTTSMSGRTSVQGGMALAALSERQRETLRDLLATMLGEEHRG